MSQTKILVNVEQKAYWLIITSVLRSECWVFTEHLEHPENTPMTIRCNGYLFFFVRNASTSISDLYSTDSDSTRENLPKKLIKLKKRPKISDKNIEINKTLEIIETKEIKSQYKGKNECGTKWEKEKRTLLTFAREQLLKIMSASEADCKKGPQFHRHFFFLNSDHSKLQGSNIISPKIEYNSLFIIDWESYLFKEFCNLLC